MRRAALAMALAMLSAAAVAAAEPSWYRAPRLSVMTGFIYEPRKPYTIEQWKKGLGSRFDADRWVADFQEAGATYLIFYDKWIDGFVFHDTKTTKFKADRDFVREIAAACQRRNLRLVFYFNAVSDGNPEFDEWAVRDKQGRFIVFGAGWPTHYQTLHSPFRKVSVEQVRELLTGYGRIDGLWLDIFDERLNTSSPWVAQAYEKAYREPFDRATPQRLADFNVRTLAGYLDEVQPIARKHQPDFAWTANGSALYNNRWAQEVGARLTYGSVEGHRLDRMEALGRLAWISPKPVEIGLLLCASWFTPLEDKPPPAAMDRPKAIALAALALCQGSSIYMALTPGHAGTFGEDLRLAKAVGDWFRAVQPFLDRAEPWGDVGLVLGTPHTDVPDFDTSVVSGWDPKEKRDPASDLHWALGMSEALLEAGAPARLLYAPRGGPTWPASLKEFRAIVLPQFARLDDEHAARLREYVRDGGRLIAFGRASMLDEAGARQPDYALADVLGAHYKGEAALSPKPGKADVKVDSEYAPEYPGRHLVDGRPTFWASADTPMPHWTEIVLAEPVEVAKVELVSREGPYLVTDVDVEVHDGKQWRLAGSVRGAKDRRIILALDRPSRADRVRVVIRRELFEGRDRPIADVEAIRILDPAGRDWAADAAGAALRITAATPEAEAALKDGVTCRSTKAVRVEPAGAAVLARFDDADASPALLRHGYGRGEAVLVTADETGFGADSGLWNALVRFALGKPALTGHDSRRYRLILTRVGGRRVLHVIDRAADQKNYHPAETAVALDADRFGPPERVLLVGGEQTPAAELKDGRCIVRVRPDPVATLVFP